jgi:hypothetical protein
MEAYPFYFPMRKSKMKHQYRINFHNGSSRASMHPLTAKSMDAGQSCTCISLAHNSMTTLLLGAAVSCRSSTDRLRGYPSDNPNLRGLWGS